MNRATIVGREMIVGSRHGLHHDDDMDELLHHTSVGAEHHEELAEHPQALAHPPAHAEYRGGRESRQYDYRPHAGHRESRQHYYEEEEPMPPPRRRHQHPEHGPRVVHSESTHEKRRHFPIGFTQTGITPGQVAEVEVKPQVLFRGERLAVAPSNARSFNIVDIKVGKDSQLAATGEMPAEAFSALAVGVRMELDTAQPGIVIVLIVRNTDTTNQDFNAVLYGTVFED
ncbi:MAG TPA: hypothetical protein VGI39_25080 [Polyangiaceae bacterium]|jgi:hypothetical protein